MARRIYLYDSTLRDGAQTSGVDFSAADKRAIAQKLDSLGIDYIEGGWPGANPTDDAFFTNLPKLKTSTICAFGMTRKSSTTAANDPGLAGLINSDAKTLCIFGKSWDFHVTDALGISLEENLELISDSLTHAKNSGKEVFFDAEHFFDGFKANKEHALNVIKTAYKAGARWIILCDTNGGTLPSEIYTIVTEVTEHIPGDHLGIHCHNDTENAVANSLAAVEAGACHVQGTLNGLGERCGNANLISIIPSLKLKMGLELGVSDEQMANLTSVSRFLDEKLNRAPNRFAAYVGQSAFAHKGGVHASAVNKNPKSYEHIEPELVGNHRQILVSNQAGRANIVKQLNDINIDADHYPKGDIAALIETIKERESKGYAYESADASFELLAHQMLHDVPVYFKMESFRITDERSWSQNGALVILSEATARINVSGELIITSAQGNGPVNALDNAIRDALGSIYPALQHVSLVDYKVRIINSSHGTDAITRVLIESEDETGMSWTTVGVSTNIIDASYNALRDSLVYKLFKEKTPAKS